LVDILTLADFSPHLNRRFPLRLAEGGGLDLELIEAKALKAHGSPRAREPFSLIFRGPRERQLEQGTYDFGHPTLGGVSLFIVPLGPEGDPDGTHYQALFN
jgi:hypothetical protein